VQRYAVRVVSTCLVLAFLGSIAGIVLAGQGNDSGSRTLRTTAVRPSAAAPISSLRPRRIPTSRLIGQTLMGRLTGVAPSPSFLERIRRGELGGVFIAPDNFQTLQGLRAMLARLQAAAAAGGNPPLIVATDQEGGLVRKLSEGPPYQSAQEMGRTGTVASVRRAGEATGLYLRANGVVVDLAPVLDVPDSSRSFLGSRAFSNDPRITARLGPAFAAGLQRVGVAAAAKHFPGLGTAGANTDGGYVVVTSRAGELERRLAPFKAAIDRGIRMVMVSNAGYSSLDTSGIPAVLSRKIVNGLLRTRLRFGGVVISDSMSTAGPSRYRNAPTAALNAGVDVLLYSDAESASAAAYTVLQDGVRRRQLSRSTLQTAYNRVLALKNWLRTRR
jgi:beta-N-acetylhexosaminidase